MMKTPTILALAALSGSLAAQPLMVSLPATPPAGWKATNVPFAGQSGLRYQQFFSAPQLVSAIGHPVRFTGVDFPAGSPGGQNGAQIDIEIVMGNGPVFPSSVLDANLLGGGTVVVPRSVHTLGPATGVPLSLPFKVMYGTEFVWDGTSPLVVEVKLFSNGKPNNLAYSYDLLATFSSPEVTRLWGAAADPRAVSVATFFQNNSGIGMTFTYEEGITVPYGAGCAGAGGFVPEASTTGGHPLPANAAWTHVCTKAASQANAVLIFGGSDQMWGSLTLPFNLAPIGAPNCDLLTDIAVTLGTQTIGGGNGSGTAMINVPIPPVTIFFGQSLYSQWLIYDAGAVNGQFAMSQGLRSIFG